jgi:hypothetical protein
LFRVSGRGIQHLSSRNVSQTRRKMKYHPVKNVLFWTFPAPLIFCFVRS